MRKTPFYYDNCDRIDTEILVSLQADNLYSTIGFSNNGENSFLSYVVCQKTLLASLRIDLTRIAVRRNSSRITGFVTGMSPVIANHVSYLQPIVKTVLPKFSYPCFMQMCVETQNRRKYIGKKLLEQMEYEARRQNFGAMISEVHGKNKIGQSFLNASGFSLLFSTISPHSDIFFKKL